MTTKDAAMPVDSDRMKANMARVEELTQRLVDAFARRNPANPTLDAPDQELFAKAATNYMGDMTQQPARIFEHQLEFWGKSVKHFMEAQQALSRGKLEAPVDRTPDDPRFKNPLWKTNPYFNFIKQ
mgnify:FL=1